MRGYWARPDLDREAFFIKQPWADDRRKFYRTGDLVREREDGNLLFLGRKDRQIKVRGYRVELDEIENVLGGLEEVAEAAAVAVLTGEGETTILAAVSPISSSGCDPNEVRRRSAERLPPYAVPQKIEVIDRFPRTGSGKIDRPALAEQLKRLVSS